MQTERSSNGPCLQCCVLTSHDLAGLPAFPSRLPHLTSHHSEAIALMLLFCSQHLDWHQQDSRNQSRALLRVLLLTCGSFVVLQVFYGFGLAGLAWSVWWEAVVKGIEASEPEEHAKLTRTSRQQAAAAAAPGAAAAAEEPMPWRAFLRNTPVRALAYTHFCNNWCAPKFQQLQWVVIGSELYVALLQKAIKQSALPTCIPLLPGGVVVLQTSMSVTQDSFPVHHGWHAMRGVGLVCKLLERQRTL